MSLKNLSLIRTIKTFTLSEKLVFYLLFIIFLTTGLAIIFKHTDALFTSVPAYGGDLNEGIIGYPRYVNPVLSITEAGGDLTSLLYSGLLKENPDGTLSPNLADNYTVSQDGLIYDVYLKDGLTFHDGQPLNADDVIFTLDKVKDVNIKSPVYVNWQGVTISKIDNLHVQFNLKKAYAPFAFNLTLGILPKHIWQNITDDQFSFSSYNYEPVGEGPYQFVEIKRDNDGLPLFYKLKAFDDFTGGEPYIQNITLNFYKDAASALFALKNNKITSLGGIPNNLTNDIILSSDKEIKKLNFLRTFSVFFNQNQSDALINIEVRKALEAATDRNKIIDLVLGGNATPAYSPIPDRLLSSNQLASSSSSFGESESERINNAKSILLDGGWRLNSEGIMEKHTSKGTTTLSFTLATSNNEELKQTADILKEMWGKIGAKVEIETYDANTLNQTIIRPRKYQALLFGEVLGHDVDLYPFWHSSERTDPGLNVAIYTNIKSDKALEDERTATTTASLINAYDIFNAELLKDVPAVFLYTPQYIYVVPKELQGFSLSEIETPEDRFEGIEKRFMVEKKVLKIFNKK